MRHGRTNEQPSSFRIKRVRSICNRTGAGPRGSRVVVEIAAKGDRCRPVARRRFIQQVDSASSGHQSPNRGDPSREREEKDRRNVPTPPRRSSHSPLCSATFPGRRTSFGKVAHRSFAHLRQSDRPPGVRPAAWALSSTKSNHLHGCGSIGLAESAKATNRPSTRDRDNGRPVKPEDCSSAETSTPVNLGVRPRDIVRVRCQFLQHERTEQCRIKYDFCIFY